MGWRMGGVRRGDEWGRDWWRMGCSGMLGLREIADADDKVKKD